MTVAELSADDDGRSVLTDLHRWLAADDDLQGYVRLAAQTPAEGELGAGPGVLSVLLGSGGVGVALAASLKAWIASRRSKVRVKVDVKGRTIEVDADNLADVMPVIERVLREIDDHSAS